MSFSYSKSPQGITANWKDALSLSQISIIKIAPLLAAIVLTKNIELILGIEWWLLSLSIFIASLILNGAIIHSMHTLANGAQPNLIGSLVHVFEKLVQLIIGFLMSALLIGLGTILFIIPGIVLGFSTFFHIPLILLDGHPGFEAVNRSRQLVKGWWWKSFITIGAPGLVVLPIALFKYIIFSFINIDKYSQIILTELISCLFICYQNSTILVHFNDLKLNRPQ